MAAPLTVALIAAPRGTQALYHAKNHAKIRAAVAGSGESSATRAGDYANGASRNSTASGKRLPLALNDEERKAWSQTVR